ncbi:hypothetical protein IWQ60_002844 [Tieghemiomyces parasiticus]|uniref:DNA-directed RNA polymerase III subunit n=1 Tax=Tieghemiomyces parasiticus TaxID=78921 RepID=A0A9W8DVC1_9FUNG|nr:hypothetical protein IWQ60_002844 [Tieghemiomyces parasiticus]
MGASLFKDPGDLFPSIDLPQRQMPTSQERETLDLFRAYKEELQQTPFYLVPPPPPKEIERYSDKYFHNTVPAATVGKLYQANLDSGFFPPELHGVVDRAQAKKGLGDVRKRTTNVDLDALDALDGEDGEGDKDGEKGEGDDEEGPEEELDDEEHEEENDYMDTYFDNGEGDDEIDDGDDREQTY